MTRAWVTALNWGSKMEKRENHKTSSMKKSSTSASLAKQAKKNTQNVGDLYMSGMIAAQYH